MSNLLDKASIVTTPTAYDNGKILSVKPNTSVGDFDFTRNSSATRVNSQGLIEDVQILSSNLVTNGDFSQEGSELVTNGDFATDSNWNKGANWSIEDNKLVGSNADTSTYQGVGIQVNKSYKIQFTVIDYVSGSVRPLLNGLPNVDGTNVSSNGTYTQYLQSNSGSNGNFTIKGVFFNGSVTNVSVKEVGQDWTLGTGVTIGENKAIFTSTASGQSVSQNAVASSLTNGALAKVSFEVLSRTQGSFGVYFSGTLVGTLASAGVFTGYFTKGTETSFYIRALGTTSGSITNISVIEITEDTNLPRIDYTGGEGHWLFEPQSTNLFLNSEPTTNEGTSGNITYESFNWALGFSNCVRYGDNSALRFRYGGTVSASTKYTLSAFVIMDDLSEPITGGQTSGDDFTFVLGGSVFSNANSSVSMGNNIWRVSITATTSASPNAGRNGLIKFTTQSSKGFRVVSYQLEQQSFATSYIPTNGSTVTRLQDAAFGAGSSDLINSTEGVLYAEIAALSDGGVRKISISDGSLTNYVSFEYSVITNLIRIRLVSGGVEYSFYQSTSYNYLQYHKIAISYKINDFKIYIDGLIAHTDTSSIMPIGLDVLNFSSGNGAERFFGKAKCVAVFKEALTDAELTCLTTI